MTSGSSYDVLLVWRDGSEETIRVEGTETVLAAAERAGVALPFGCLTGACATCTGRVLDGELVHTREPRALKPHQRDANYVLLCLAEPRSDCRIEVGAAVQTDLVSNPWK